VGLLAVGTLLNTQSPEETNTEEASVSIQLTQTVLRQNNQTPVLAKEITEDFSTSTHPLLSKFDSSFPVVSAYYHSDNSRGPPSVV